MSGAGYKIRDDTHSDVPQGERPVHPRGKPDNPHNNAKDRDAPPFLHLGHHQQIDGAAQQGRPHGHVEGQNRVRSEWKSTDQGKHKENGAEYARSHQVLDS